MDIDDDDFPVSKIIFIGNYLKELYIDHEYGKLLTEFIFYSSEINYLSWFVQGEQHSVNWSNQAFHI